MKSSKIFNLFIISVINLSIIFLYNNNLYATFINGILQTGYKNLWNKKQRSLAEGGSSTIPEVPFHLEDFISNYIEKMLVIEMETFYKLLNVINEKPNSEYEESINNLSLYSDTLKSHALSTEIGIEDSDVEFWHNRFRKFINYVLGHGNMEILYKQTIECIDIQYTLLNKLINLYIQEPDETVKKGMVNAEYIEGFMESQSASLISKLHSAMYPISFDICWLMHHILQHLRSKNIIS